VGCTIQGKINNYKCEKKKYFCALSL